MGAQVAMGGPSSSNLTGTIFKMIYKKRKKVKKTLAGPVDLAQKPPIDHRVTGSGL
eukprot:NODE_387_length_883_cov_417.279101_g379_i0.p4 GENE.NODE_387_length_883_cov_417.279101_g379_i0~~NODE_387_length_883_cov_417.279101_g379_i0.p4  ORF type:complete len:56 (+),score=13.75 NODE_387_length_883_cov_417.279101_g379_i0:105-272(+)